jgi:hypothetical protein
MFRRICVLVFFAVAAFAADTLRLYLKDGTYQLTREYEVKQDRVRYFSTEREDWEEIPLEMVDLARTKKEVADHEAARKEDAKAQAEEDAALRDAAKEVDLVPAGPGVYYVGQEKIQPMKVAESTIVNDKRRTVLKILSPVPMVAGKETVELNGAGAALRVFGNRPEFYFRLSDEERFAIIKLTPTKKNSRIVESIDVIPVSKELMEHFDEIACFKRQVGDLLFKIWPEKELDPGEYAVIEHTEGKINLQVWDFGVGSAPEPSDSPKKKK